MLDEEESQRRYLSYPALVTPGNDQDPIRVRMVDLDISGEGNDLADMLYQVGSDLGRLLENCWHYPAPGKDLSKIKKKEGEFLLWIHPEFA